MATNRFIVSGNTLGWFTSMARYFYRCLLTCLYDSLSVPLSLSIAVGNTLEVVTASYFILRFASARPFFKTIHTAVFIIALFGSTMISASIGVGSLFFADLIQQNNLLLVWKTWWLRDLVGGLILTPIFINLAFCTQ